MAAALRVVVVAERPVLAHLAVVAQLLLQRQPALLVALEVAAARPVVLPQEAELAAAALLLVQGLVPSERLRRRWPFSTSTARISPSTGQPTYERAASSR